ncbi:hypothetical protein THOB06_460002 [Vibrio rotiferianus]|nr:hypothetical protein THOB06_460002 [Vibrio rotiferianus]
MRHAPLKTEKCSKFTYKLTIDSIPIIHVSPLTFTKQYSVLIRTFRHKMLLTK